MSLPYFQGNMTAEEARIMLQQEQNGAFLLRKNPEGEYVISFKYNQTISSVALENRIEEEGTYSIVNPVAKGEKIVATSLRALVDQLRTKNVLSNPVICAAPAIQSSNPTAASQIISRLKANICSEKERRICCPLKGSEDLEEETFLEQKTDPGNVILCSFCASASVADQFQEQILCQTLWHQLGIHKMRHY